MTRVLEDEEEAGMDDIEVHNSPVVQRLNAQERKRRLQKCCIFLVVIVVIVLVIGLGVGLGINSGNSNSGGESNTSGNNSPSSLSFFISSLGVSDNKTLANSSSPQHAALNWLMNDTANSQYKFDSDSITSNSTLQLIAKQRYAAATIYYSLQGKSWTNSSGWMSSSDVCTWNGVFCGTNSSNATVQALILDQQKLSGTLPPEIQLFDLLEQISCYNNAIAGSLPLGFFNLSKLQSVELTSNRLSGQISSMIGQLSNLVYLNLGNNRFNGVIPTSIGLTTGLQYLVLDNNTFSSNVTTIPSELGQLTNLKTLSMRNLGGFNGGIGGKIPTELGNCQKLGA
jgi:Leucine-rich repeat (LRR) protein